MKNTITIFTIGLLLAIASFSLLEVLKEVSPIMISSTTSDELTIIDDLPLGDPDVEEVIMDALLIRADPNTVFMDPVRIEISSADMR
jgi:hypothetical protein